MARDLTTLDRMVVTTMKCFALNPNKDGSEGLDYLLGYLHVGHVAGHRSKPFKEGWATRTQGAPAMRHPDVYC